MATAPSKLALFLLLAACSAAIAQQQRGMPSPMPSPSPPQFPPDSDAAPLKVTTQLTLENVTVVDAAGKPVLGLKQSDFSVKEDGKPQKIKNFEEYGAEGPSQQSAPPRALPPHVYTNAQSAGPQSGAVNILLLDMLNTGPIQQAMVKEKAIAYLGKMPTGTEIAIFVLGRELRVLQGFTTDRAVLLAAVNSIQPNTVIVQAVLVQSVTGGCSVCRAVQRICDILNRRSTTTLDSLDAIAAFGSGIKGRKNLLWFTTGLPQITAFNWVYNIMRVGGWTPTLVDYTSNLQRAYSLLAAAQVAVYPIDPRGLGNNTAGTVGELMLGDAPLEEMPQYILNANASIKEIAANTGGLAYYGRNDLDGAIGEAIDSGAHSYSLSYVPPSSKEGKYHKVEIAVDRPGLRLQYRQNYTTVALSEPPADTKAADNAPAPDSNFHAAVDKGVIPSTGLQFYLRVAPSIAPAKPGDPPVAGVLNAKLKGKPLVRYILMYEVPAGEVTLVDGPDGTRRGSLEFDVVAFGSMAYGEDPLKLNVVREVVNFTLKANEVEHFVKNPFAMPVQIDLPPGKLDLHAGVLDASSQKMGTLEIPETVTSQQQASK
jgi:VWFA-related protein